MASALVQKSAFVGTMVPSAFARSNTPSAGSQASNPLSIHLVRSQSVSDANRQGTSSQRRPQDPLAALQSSKPQDITLLGSSSGAAYSAFWDNVLSEPKVEDANSAVSEVADQQTRPRTSQRSSIGSQDWRAVRRVAQSTKFDSAKARELRKKLRETESFHDTFYHSHVAEMLANQID